jgi:hypothetical protein
MHGRDKRTPRKKDKSKDASKQNTLNTSNLMAASLAQGDAGVGDTLSDTYTVADSDTIGTDFDDLSLGGE